MTLSAKAVAALLISVGLPNIVFAADLINSDPVPMEITEAAQDDHFFYFDVAGSFGIVIPLRVSVD